MFAVAVGRGRDQLRASRSMSCVTRFFGISLVFLAIALSARAQVGGLDPGFQPGAIMKGSMPGEVRAMANMSDGRIVIAGDFTSVGGAPRNCIARLNANGSLDTTFAPPIGANGPIN